MCLYKKEFVSLKSKELSLSIPTIYRKMQYGQFKREFYNYKQLTRRNETTLKHKSK